MTIVEWAFLGALFLGIVLFSARIMRKGLASLDEDREKCLERIREGERRIAEDRKNISSSDQLWIMRTALEDLLRLNGNPEGFQVRGCGKYLDLDTPDGPWHIELDMREQRLRSTSRVLHGKSRWVLTGFGLLERHSDPGALMASLQAHLRNESTVAAEPEHLARRLGAKHA